MGFSKKLLAILLCAAMLFGVVAVCANADGEKVGAIIEFGSYPQSKVTDDSIISQLNAKAGTWTSYGYYSNNAPSDYMRYCDVPLDGQNYRGVIFSKCRPERTSDTAVPTTDERYFQVLNKYYCNQVYWFKYEALNWRVLDPTTGLYLCENVIDAQPYNNLLYLYEINGVPYGYGDQARTHYANEYNYSSIRTWLTNDFYDTAFDASEQSEMQSGGKAGDKVFLLTLDDAKNSAYGFVSDNSRTAIPTDYSKCQAVHVNGNNGCTDWYLWTEPNISAFVPTTDSAKLIGSDGGTYGNRVNETFGVRPAIIRNPGGASASSYTVTYNATGGTVSPSSASVAEGGSVTLPTPQKSYSIIYEPNGGSNAPGVKFVTVPCQGWATINNTEFVDFDCGSSYTPSSDITLYAVWDDRVTTTLSPLAPTSSGRTFLGWSTDPRATEAEFDPGDTVILSSDVVLYAVWDGEPGIDNPPVSQPVTLYYDANGGKGAPAPQTTTTGTLKLSEVKPIRFGRSFLGWSEDPQAVTSDFQPGEDVNIYGDTTLYAVWSAPTCRLPIRFTDDWIANLLYILFLPFFIVWTLTGHLLGAYK